MFGAIAVMALAPWLDTSSVALAGIAQCSVVVLAVGNRFLCLDVAGCDACRRTLCVLLADRFNLLVHFLVIPPSWA